jgi:adenylate cyclase class 1
MITESLVQKILARNKRIFAAYNEFRKSVFIQLAPKEAETILYLLPWLLSINEPQCPGYISDLKRPFRVFDIDYVKEIRKREPEFKQIFGLQKTGTLLKPLSSPYLIQGLYTIGSVGSVGQTSTSDCDIWVCIDKKNFDRSGWIQINQKVNLIKDWMDSVLKLPVYFFISDVAAIRECRFGHVDSESCGSTQQEVLKEEFYRSAMVICGKTPLWWLCYNTPQALNYAETLAIAQKDDYWQYDVIDFGDIQKIDKKEYFGAALWQFHKSLSRPLKSLIKIILLKSLLDAPNKQLLCHQFRELVMACGNSALYPDFSVFTMSSILDGYRSKSRELTRFLSECYFILCEINLYDPNQKLKNTLVSKLLNQYPIGKKRQIHLRKSKQWDFREQMDFGNRIFKLLLQIYREISDDATDVVSESDQKDLTILGRKISAYYVKKKYKVPVIQNPMGILNVANLTLHFTNDIWQAFSGNDLSIPIIWGKSIHYVLAFVVWNNLFTTCGIRMRPNSSNITLQEIINLGTKLQSFFGISSALDIDFGNFLREESIAKLLVVLDFVTSPWYVNTKDYCAIYTNCWGELFVRHFSRQEEFESFLQTVLMAHRKVDISYYVQRNSSTFEKMIEKAKRGIALKNDLPHERPS